MKDSLVRDLLTDLLTKTVSVLDAPPARQFVAHGDAFAHDCECVAARLVSIRTESSDLGRGTQSCALIPVVALQLLVLRCYPKIDGEGIPAADDLTAASLTLADDSVALTGGLLDLWDTNALFPTVGDHCDRVELGVLEPVSPEGGLAGWRTTIEVRT